MQNITFKEHLKAYLIDMLVMFIFIALVSFILGGNNANITNLTAESDALKDSYLSHNISFSTFIHNYAEIAYDVDKYQVLSYIIDALFIIGYFVFVPFFRNGQTLGKKLTHIKVIEENNKYLGLNNLMMRSFITTGLFAMLISLALIYLVPAWVYFVSVSIINFIQFLLVIISAFMIIYRRDKCGLQDMLGHTRVVKE
jgi:uncharacterized RDD family membrane protein YckC